ncbi:P-loop containing nucleoside triphosphate hydrolase protein [Rhypophila sp. PSN 637]
MAPLAPVDDVLDRYIPVGCLQVQLSPNEIRTQQAVWSLSRLDEWQHFGKQDVHNSPLLPQHVQKALLLSHTLSPFARLVDRKWVHLSLKMDPSDRTRFTIRVFILPDDVDNKSVPRSDDACRKARRKLMSRLDCSSNAWGGTFSSGLLLTPPSDDDGPSLLELFNSIPSPDPSQQTIQDPDYAGAIEDVMESDVHGLKTTLYPYQRMSVAVMLQREAAARRILDPRLTERRDHSDRKWYHDPVIGTVLREPRFYDSPRGGILAEEMGSGKTLICLTLCLATRHMPARMPEEQLTEEQLKALAKPVVRPKLGSLADMAAARVAKSGTSWKPKLEGWYDDKYYDRCIEAIKRNPGFYTIRQLPRRRTTRFSLTSEDLPPSHVYLSHASLVVVPPNLAVQWTEEIKKHTTGMKVFLCAQSPDAIPSVKDLLEYDLVLFSSTVFDQLARDRRNMPDGTIALDNPLARVHFKRCIVDEGHRLGNSTSNRRLDLQAVLGCLHYTARWIVTGTPSKGLFGLEEPSGLPAGSKHLTQSSPEQEKGDLRRLGAIAKHYLMVRPWAKVPGETGETPAEWSEYVMQRKHSSKGVGSPESLKATLESLIIRHRLTDVKKVLPRVKERIVYLTPCYQDRLVLNLFSMMIIFNSVQSQRQDQDYFFHPGQRKSLDQLVSNLSQASFFGASFFSVDDLNKAIDTAEKFLAEKKVQIGFEDDVLLRRAISFGRLATRNTLKSSANLFHELPVMVKNFPFADISPSVINGWSLSDQNAHEYPPLEVCMSAKLISTLQGTVKDLQRNFGYYDSEDELRMRLGASRLARQGQQNKQTRNQNDKSDSSVSRPRQRPALAGNTQLGEDKSDLSVFSSRRAAAFKGDAGVKDKGHGELESPGSDSDDELDMPEPFRCTQMISTASAKLSYLIDQIVQHHRDEQILVFYDNDNIAYYLAEVLEVLGIQHLIYAKGITQVLKATYVAAFTKGSSKFRVMLMDIHQAAFGLNMQSASRIYFINPVFKRQVEAQAIGRARRIGQSAESVTVETLVLKGSMEELIVKRRSEMTPHEQQKCQSVIDDKPIYDWIINAKILPLPGVENPPSDSDQMAQLKAPQLIFGRGFGRETYHDDRELGEALEGQPKPQKVERAMSPVAPAGSPPSASRFRSASMSEQEPGSKRVRFA